MQQRADLLGLDASNGGLAVDLALVDHVHGNAYGGGRTALARARLQHEEAAVLDRELEILHLGVVGLEGMRIRLELAVDFGQRLPQRADLFRRTNAGHHVFALGIEQVFAKSSGLPSLGSRVKATPVPERSPMFPKTIVCTLQAVPQSCGRRWKLR